MGLAEWLDSFQDSLVVGQSVKVGQETFAKTRVSEVGVGDQLSVASKEREVGG